MFGVLHESNIEGIDEIKCFQFFIKLIENLIIFNYCSYMHIFHHNLLLIMQYLAFQQSLSYIRWNQ